MNILTKFREKLNVVAEAIGRLYGRSRIVQDFWSDREMVLIDSSAKPLGLGSNTTDLGIWCGLWTRQSSLNVADSNKDIPNQWDVREGGDPPKFPGSSNLTVGPYNTVTMLRDYTYVDYDINKIIVSPLWPFITLIDDGVIVPILEVSGGEEEDSYFIGSDGVEFKHPVPEGFIRDDYDVVVSLAIYGEIENINDGWEIKK
jgi:hypothetical protein